MPGRVYAGTGGSGQTIVVFVVLVVFLNATVAEMRQAFWPGADNLS